MMRGRLTYPCAVCGQPTTSRVFVRTPTLLIGDFAHHDCQTLARSWTMLTTRFGPLELERDNL